MQSYMRHSGKCIEFIQYFEGFSPFVYTCPGGKKTIGYGHVVQIHETQYQSFRRYRISYREAVDLLIQDMKVIEDYINEVVRVDLKQWHFDALVSFIFNIGCGAFSRSTLLKHLNKKNYEEAGQEFSRWVYAGTIVLRGLKIRREAEKKMFLTGKCDFIPNYFSYPVK